MKKKQIIGVLGLLVNNKGRVLITRRNDSVDSQMNGLWQVPGGALEFGEKPVETMHRELKEELGVSDIEVLTLLPFVGSDVRKNKHGGYHIILMCYLGNMKHEQPIFLNEEASEYRWINSKEINTIPHMPFVDNFVKAAKQYIEQNPTLFRSGRACSTTN